MSSHDQHHALTPGRERATLLTLGAIQFTHILDFMIMMPLGAQLMQVFRISPAQFTHLVASYGFAAAVSGLAGGFVMDRYDRKRALVVMYAGFGLATLACALAPNHHALLAARIAAGAFGGLAGSLVNAMIGDIVPPFRRGRAMGYVMAAFPIASVVGVPLGLVLAGKFGWHAPFFLLAGCACVVFAVANFTLPAIRTAVHDHQPLAQMKQILAKGIHRRAFALSTVLVMAGGTLIPFIAPSFIANVRLDEKFQLPVVYIVGGLATVLTTPAVGWLSDHMDRFKLLTSISLLAIVAALWITRLGPTSLAVASVVMAMFMVSMSGRFSPAMTMVTNAVEARYRGGFMSVNAALQQAASAGASMLAGEFVLRAPDGHLSGLPLLGWVSIGFFLLTVLVAAELRAAAPHVALPQRQPAAVPVDATA